MSDHDPARIDAINAAAAAVRRVDPDAAAFTIAATVVDAVSPIIRAYMSRLDEDEIRTNELERIEMFVKDLRQEQWDIMKSSREEDDTLGRQDYMIASAEAHAAQKILDFIREEQ